MIGSVSDNDPKTTNIYTGFRTGCLGRIVQIAMLLWIIPTIFFAQLWAWLGPALDGSPNAALMTVAAMIQIGAPLALLAWLWRPLREQAMYRTWLLAALYLLLMAPARLLPPTSSQLILLLQLGVTLLFIVGLWAIGSAPERATAPRTAWYIARAVAGLFACFSGLSAARLARQQTFCFPCCWGLPSVPPSHCF